MAENNLQNWVLSNTVISGTNYSIVVGDEQSIQIGFVEDGEVFAYDEDLTEDPEDPYQSMIESGYCDFCHRPNPTWQFPTESFSFGPIDSVGDWAACGPCKENAEQEEWGPIATRQMSLYTAEGNYQTLYNAILDLQQEFVKHRKGKPSPLTPVVGKSEPTLPIRSNKVDPSRFYCIDCKQSALVVSGHWHHYSASNVDSINYVSDKDHEVNPASTTYRKEELDAF